MPTLSQLFPPKAILRIGSNGQMVKAVQKALATYGYPLSGTGYFGNETLAAVRAFQKRAGLNPDGEVGGETVGALDRGLKSDLTKVPEPVKAEIARPLWLQISIDHIGLKEMPGAGDNKELVADIQTVAHDYQHDATPWCAGWMSFTLASAGLAPSSRPLWALSYADTKNEPVVRLPGPAVGAIAVKTRQGGGHVTCVAGRTSSGYLACCGGNQNDMINITPYSPAAFVGFFWPKLAPLPAKTGFASLPVVSSNGRVSTNEA